MVYNLRLWTRLLAALCLLGLALTAVGCAGHHSRKYTVAELRTAFAKAKVPLATVAVGQRQIVPLLRSNYCGSQPPDDPQVLSEARAHLRAVLRSKPQPDKWGGKIVLSAYLFDIKAMRNGHDFLDQASCLYLPPSHSGGSGDADGNLVLWDVNVTPGSSGSEAAGLMRVEGALGLHNH